MAAQGERVAQPFEVALQHRSHRGVDRRRDPAFVLARLADEGVSRGHVVVRPQLAGDGLRQPLVHGVPVGVQEVDDQRLAARLEQRGDRLAQSRLVERTAHSSGRVDALVDLAAERAGDQRHEATEQPVGRRAGAPSELQHVAEAARRDQAGAREPALEHRVGGDRGAVDDQVDVVDGPARRPQHVEHADGGVRGRARRLADLDRAVALVDDHEIRERAADIDAGDDVTGVPLAGTQRSQPANCAASASAKRSRSAAGRRLMPAAALRPPPLSNCRQSSSAP